MRKQPSSYQIYPVYWVVRFFEGCTPLLWRSALLALTLICGWSRLALAGAIIDQRDPIEASLVLKVGNSRADADVVYGGHHLLVVLSKAPHDLQQQLDTEMPRGLTARVESLPHGAAGIYFAHRLPIIDHTLRRQASRLQIVIKTEPLEVTLAKRLRKGLPKNIPSSFTAKHFKRAERAFRGKKLDKAIEQLNRLTGDYATQAWASLRLADIILLQNGREAGCTAYNGVYSNYGARTAGVVAHMRLYQLRCSGHTVDSLQLADLIKKVRRIDGHVGLYLWRESLWTLFQAGYPKQINFALGLLHTMPGLRLRRGMLKNIHDMLLARSFYWQEGRYERAQWVLRYKKAMKKHPDQVAMVLQAAIDLDQLDIPNVARKLLSTLSEKEKRTGTTQNSILVVSAKKLKKKGGKKKVTIAKIWKSRMGEQHFASLAMHQAMLLGKHKSVTRLQRQYKKKFRKISGVNAVKRSLLTLQDISIVKDSADVGYRTRVARNAVNALFVSRKKTQSKGVKR